MAYSKEHARDILKEISNGPEKEYFEAIVNETLPQYYFNELQMYLLYSDKFPHHILADIRHPDYPFMKCRGTAIIGIGLKLQGLIRDNIVEDQSVVDVVSKYRAHDWSFQKGSKGEYWTSRKEINLINRTLKTVTTHIKDKYGLEHDSDSIRKKFEDRLSEVRKPWLVN